ncbi:MAG: hypothetical protein IT210_06405 [Armatimonadetes bacterium]|nr:hypothetical protein [Armatimonadota bacterium]
MAGSFKINDLRGEYWLYPEGGLQVNIERGAAEGGCHVNTRAARWTRTGWPRSWGTSWPISA